MSDFVHLHLHTEYSLLDGFSKIDDLFDQVRALGMEAVAITDHGTMFGVVEFYKKALKAGIKPIIGCEVYVANRNMNDRDQAVDKTMGHLVLLVENARGYQNLIKLVSESYTRGFYYKPRVDLALLEAHTEGLIALSACLAGDVQREILNGDLAKAEAYARRYHEMFGPDHFYLELQDHGIPEQQRVNRELASLSEKLEIPLVATNDVHYLKREDAFSHDVLLCIQTGKTLDDANRLSFPSDEFYLKSPLEMRELFPDHPEALANTVAIAQRCAFDFDFDSRYLPHYSEDPDFDTRQALESLCLEGLKKKYDDYLIHLDRLHYELGVIDQMGFNDYFLIVWDFIRYAREKGIAVGPGRGSVGGSLVAYALDITQVDPIRYDLIFERFLNPERITMPDIDIDFEDERRQEVIDYVKEKYGEDHVAQIITFGTFGARAAVRDVGRVLGIPYGEVDRLAKMIPFALGMTLKRALKENEKLSQAYEEDSQVKQVIDLSLSIEGLPRHVSTHAAGVVISEKPVDQHVPLYVHDGNVSTQFNMVLLEELGLLKMDFLGLRNLTIIKNTLEILSDSQGIEIDIERIPLDDPKVFDLLSSGKTLGIFQLESTGMRSFVKELKPETLEDIIAGISLYRPGPMESIPRYIRNKTRPESITYEDEALRDILDVTYGCLVYQEQVMEIVRKLAGYSYGRSDLVRRAMSKKKFKVMELERKNFIYGTEGDDGPIPGCLANGIPKEVAESVFDDMIDFAKYAFNKSHAAGYALLAYQTAYLKTHHPTAFMAAVMSTVMSNHKKLGQYIQDLKEMGIPLLPPDINHSHGRFSVEGGAIRFGLIAIKNVGRSMIETIKSVRRDRPFSGFRDFIDRMDSSELNRRAIESLIKGGAFDSFGLTRRQLLSVYEKEIDMAHRKQYQVARGQIGIFDDMISGDRTDEGIPDMPELQTKHLLEFEKEVLGIYLSGHPLGEFADVLTSSATVSLSELTDMEDSGGLIRDGDTVSVGGMMVKLNEKITRNQNKMAFLEVEDLYDRIEVIVFPNVYRRVEDLLKSEQYFMIDGEVVFKEDEPPKIIASEIRLLSEVKASASRKIYLKVKENDAQTFKRISNILEKHPGPSPVLIFIEKENRVVRVPKNLYVSEDKVLFEHLQEVLGEDAVKTRGES